MSALLLTSCFGIDESDFKKLAPITFNEVPSVIDVSLGQELVYDGLVVTSDKDVTYQWAYGPKNTVNPIDEYDMSSMEVISDKPAINYVFSKLGSYILRLRVDNGESIEYKYFTLNVNSGLDEGLCILSNDEQGNGSLTFIKKRTAEEEEAQEQEIWPDVFKTINPDFELKNLQDIFMSVYKEASQILISTADERGTIFKLEPKTFELMHMVRVGELFNTYVAGFTGITAGSAAYYTLMRGADNKTYRYDLNGDFVGERTDANAVGKVTANASLIYTTNNKSLLYNDSTLFQPGNGSTKAQLLAKHRIVNLATDRDKNVVYVLMQSKTDPTSYTIKSTTGSLGNYKAVIDFTAESVNMDQNSIMVGSLNSSDIYYTYDNKVWRWGLTVAPPTSPVSGISIPAGETICHMATNYMYDFPDGTEETLLYIATYNESTKKGSVFVYDIATETLVKTYKDVCDRPVKMMYKYRIS